MITVFYDAKCGLCSKIMDHYRKTAPNNIFNWRDVTESSNTLRNKGVTLVQGLKKIHALDSNGEIYIGVDVFILIWKQLRRWKLLALFISLPVIKQFVNFLYIKLAGWRFKSLGHCQLALKKECKEFRNQKATSCRYK